MTDEGHIYILINPSIPDTLKIGKTERDPEDRARELSSSSGVATPFIVAYSSYFNDVTQAEAYIHSELEEYRIANNREFFQIDLKKAINVLLRAQENIGAFDIPTKTFASNDLTESQFEKKI